MNNNLELGFEKWKKECEKKTKSNYFIISGFDGLKKIAKENRPDWTKKQIEIWVLDIMRISNQKNNIIKVHWNKIKPIELFK